MQTIEAIYDNGKIIMLEKPSFTKARVRITFIQELDKNDVKVEFPVKKLGKMKKIDKNNLYEEYLSNRF
jgi:hypothetical protein